MRALLIALLIFIVCILFYMCKYKSIENFTEASLYESNELTPLDETVHDLQFDTPFDINATTLDIHKEATFKKDLKLENNMNVRFNEDMVLNSEHSINFQGRDSRMKLSRGDLVDLKKNRSKIKYIKSELEGAVLMDDGDIKAIYSSKTTGDDICSSKLWEIAIGKEVSRQELCEACCKNVKNQADFKVFLTFKDGSNDIHDFLHLDLTNGKLYSFVELKTTANKSYELTATLFRNNMSFDCKLYFLNITNQTLKNQLGSISKLEDLKNGIPTSNIERVISTLETDTQAVEWGTLNKGIHVPTTTHFSNVKGNMVLLEIIPKESQ